MNTSAWWVCSCGIKLVKVGKSLHKAWEKHVKGLDREALKAHGCSIEQVKQ